MFELTLFQKILIFALAASWILASFRATRMARNFNRNPLRWFWITILFSAIPATIVFWTDQRKRIDAEKSRQPEIDDSELKEPRPSKALMRCPHCGEVITHPEDTTEQGECPNCKQVIDGRYLA